MSGHSKKILYQLEETAIGRYMEENDIDIMDLIKNYLDDDEQALHIKLCPEN